MNMPRRFVPSGNQQAGIRRYLLTGINPHTGGAEGGWLDCGAFPCK